jgi:hypothetical protein
MTEVENDILASLLELQRSADTIRTAEKKPDLLGIFSRLDQLAAKLPKGSNPQLLHYLQNKSYAKARLLLEGRDAQNVPGNCGDR